MQGFAPGSRVGAFVVKDVLGRGGMGVVYHAVDEATGRDVALKVVLPEFARDAAFMARFAREAKTAAAVKHDNIVLVWQVGEEQGLPFLALELVGGGSLKSKLDREGPLAWRDAARVGAEIASALAAIHAAGLVHRDLKPANVLLDERGRAKLSDFGLARGTSRGQSLTKTGEVVGTAEFMAPEQLDGKRVDASADLYALGATLHALLTGHPPFGGTSYELMKRVLLEAPTPVSQDGIVLPKRLEKLVLELLAKDPDARPRRASVVADELDAIAKLDDAATRGESSRAPIFIAIGAGALAIAGALAFAFTRTPNAEPPAPSPRTSPSVAPSPSPSIAPKPSAKPSAMPRDPGRRTLTLEWEEPLANVEMHSLTLIPGGKAAILAVVEGGQFKLVRMELGATRALFDIGTHDAAIWSRPAVSPDGRLCLSGDNNGVVKLWDIQTTPAKELRALMARPINERGDVPEARSLAFVPNRRDFLVARSNLDVVLWPIDENVNVGGPRQVFQGHTAVLNCIAVRPDGDWAISGADDGLLNEWDLYGPRSEVQKKIEFLRWQVMQLAFSPNRTSRALVSLLPWDTSEREKTSWIALVDLANEKELKRHSLGGKMHFRPSIAFAPKRNDLAAVVASTDDASTSPLELLDLSGDDIRVVGNTDVPKLPKDVLVGVEFVDETHVLVASVRGGVRLYRID